MTRALLLALVLLPAAAAAQAPAKENPPAKAPERPATERPGLNLRLDNPSSFATIDSANKQAPLPTLGGDARKIAPVPESREAQTIPKDTNPAR